MDIASIIGLVMAWGLVFFAIATGAGLSAYIDVGSVMIVFGGAFGALFMKFPMNKITGMVGVMMKAIMNKIGPTEKLIDDIISLAVEAKKSGILGLEKVKIDHPFLKKGIQLAIDGVEPELIEAILKIELNSMEERHSTGRSMLEELGDSAPAFGMIGTLIGLVAMLTKMDDPKAIGPGMAVAILTTLYGALLANALFLPLANKLKIYGDLESLQKRLIIQGILSIAQGDHPAVVQEKLASFLDPKTRAKVEEAQKRKKGK